MHSTQLTRLAVGALALIAIAAGSNRDGGLRFGAANAFAADAAAVREAPRSVGMADAPQDDAAPPQAATGYHRRRR